MGDEAAGASGSADVQQAVTGLAYLCTHIEEIRALLAGDAAAQASIERLRLELKGGGEVSGPLTDIHDALQRAGDALGIYGNQRGLRDLNLAGIDDGPVEIVYRCPADRCARTVPGPLVHPPQCGLTGEALQWGQL